MADAGEELARAVTRLVMAEPFLGHLLGTIPRMVSSTATSTAAVRSIGGRVNLVVNPDFWLTGLQDPLQRVAVVKHEALHLVFRHLFRRNKRDPTLYNLAADLVVNPLVRPWPLPPGAIELASFPDLGLLPDQTVDWYYDRLQMIGEGTPLSLAELERRRDGEGFSDDHDGWGDAVGDAIAESELGRWVAHAVTRARGNVPGAFGSVITTWMDERSAKVDWRRAVRMFGTSSRRSRLDETHKRASKRYGTIPGHRIRRFARLVVAIDTSGSIDDKTLAAFFSEIRGIWRQGSEVTVLACDAAVHGAWPYRGHQPELSGGRGGTAFDPVFAWMQASGETFDGVVYLTDGRGPSPRIRPRCPTLWVISHDGVKNDPPFGRAVRLTP
jgi:predicted metal-dependent peptidase